MRVILILLLALCGCTQHSEKLKVAATAMPHAEMLEHIKPELKEKGVELEIIEVDDYQLPNRLLFEHQVDANFFQHLPFLEAVNPQYNNQLVALVNVHYEPLGIYSSKISSLEEMKEGSVVGIPCDPANEARALYLLQSLNLIGLSDAKQPTLLDVMDNPLSLKIIEIDSPMLARTLPDVTIAVIPGNFALQAHLKKALVYENETSYPNVLVIRKGDEGREDLQLLAQALTSDKMKQWLEEQYQGAVVTSNY